MKTDISRKTFDATRRYSGVRAQQGRVLMDADINEQADIVDYRNRTADTDIIGRCGAPADGGGFKLEWNGSDLSWTEGRMYVDGILVEAEEPTSIDDQPEAHGTALIPTTDGTYAFYLLVWEREIVAIDQDNLADPALPGIDPSTRVKVSWQVRYRTSSATTCDDALAEIEADYASDAVLTVTTAPTDPSTDPCLGPSDAGYRGTENQLYRVEIHTPQDGTTTPTATWKWGRENAWVVAKVETAEYSGTNPTTAKLTVDSTGPDDDRGFAIGDIVELYADELLLQVDYAATTASRPMQAPGLLGRVDKIEANTIYVLLPGSTPVTAANVGTTNIRLRKWDGAGTWNASTSTLTPLYATEAVQDLEHGIRVSFPLNSGAARTYKTGQYWIFAARTETGDVLDMPDEAPPHGPTPHFCVLGFGTRDAGEPAEDQWALTDCRELFSPLTATMLTKVSGDAQRGFPGRVLPVPIEVAVGRLPGQTVTFSTGTADGDVCADEAGTTTLMGGTAVTNADGIATCYWKLENNLAARPVQKLTASWGGQTVTFHAGFRDVCRMWVTNFSVNTAPGSLIHAAPAEQIATSSTPGTQWDVATVLGAAEVKISSLSEGNSFDIEVWQDVDRQGATGALFWDTSSVAVYCEAPGDDPCSVLRVRGSLRYVVPGAPTAETPIGELTKLRFTLIGTPPEGRYVFHLRPKVFASFQNGELAPLSALIPAPYGVLTCFVGESADEQEGG